MPLKLQKKQQKKGSAEFEIGQTLSGMKVIHQSNHYSDVCHCGVLVKTGSRDEQAGEEGYAHFLEHMVFKGTQKRKAFHILSRIDAVGGEINAYTSKEETFIFCSFLRPHYGRAIELLADIIFNSNLPAKEIEKEKVVVLDEIDSYQDSPSEQIFDDFEEYLFKGNTLSGNVLGTPESVTNINREKLMQFYKSNYQSNNMIFASTGSISMKELLLKLERNFTHQNGSIVVANRSSVFKKNSFHLEIEKSLTQCHGIIGARTFGMDDSRRRVFSLIVNILGGPALNNRLNLNIREKYGFTYNLEAHYTAYSDTGCFFVYFGTETKYRQKVVSLILKEIDKLKTKKLGSLQLHQAKQQFIGQMSLSHESKLGVMQSLGKSLMYFDKVDKMENLYHFIAQISADDILDVANLALHNDQLSHLLYIPE